MVPSNQYVFIVCLHRRAIQYNRYASQESTAGKHHISCYGGRQKPQLERRAGQVFTGADKLVRCCKPVNRTPIMNLPQSTDEAVDRALGIQGNYIPDVQKAGH